MSGIYIPGMEMPTRCGDCPFFALESAGNAMWWDYCKAKRGIVDDPDNAVSGDCPLISVPDHGDLIDRSTLGLTDFEIVMCNGDYKEGMKRLLEKIDKSTTIIPADKEAEE